MRQGSYRAKERERAIHELGAAGVPLETALLVLRDATKLARLAEAQCNGDWPADNGERKVLPCGGAEDQGCGSYWVPSVLAGKKRECPDCRAAARIKARLSSFGEVDFSGDPRGFVVRAMIGGREVGLG